MFAVTESRREPAAGEGPEGGPWKTFESSGACRGRDWLYLLPQCPLPSAGLRWAPDYLLKPKPKPKGEEAAGVGLLNSQLPPAGVAGREDNTEELWQWAVCLGPGMRGCFCLLGLSLRNCTSAGRSVSERREECHLIHLLLPSTGPGLKVSRA